MTSKRFNTSDLSSDFVPVNRKRYISGQSEVPVSKRICIASENMDGDRVANFSVSSNGVNINDQRKKQTTDKKVLAIRLVPGKFLYDLINLSI